MTKSKNELTINSGFAIGNQLMPDLFQDIDLDGLNNAIENIGSVNSQLLPEEKALARDIITEWNESVVQRLESRKYQMRDVINFFDARSSDDEMSGQSLAEFGPELAAKTGTEDELELILTISDEIQDLELAEPEKPVKSKEDTYEERLRVDKEYETARALYVMDRAKLDRRYQIAIGKFKRALLAKDDIKSLVKEAKKSINGTDKLVHMTKEKGQLAKLNISISSEKAREALKELLSFTSNI